MSRESCLLEFFTIMSLSSPRYLPDPLLVVHPLLSFRVLNSSTTWWQTDIQAWFQAGHVITHCLMFTTVHRQGSTHKPQLPRNHLNHMVSSPHMWDPFLTDTTGGRTQTHRGWANQMGFISYYLPSVLQGNLVATCMCACLCVRVSFPESVRIC